MEPSPLWHHQPEELSCESRFPGHRCPHSTHLPLSPRQPYASSLSMTMRWFFGPSAGALRRHHITTETDGDRAVARCKTQHYDVVLCDLMMPKVSGMDVHARLADEVPPLSRPLRAHDRRCIHPGRRAVPAQHFGYSTRQTHRSRTAVGAVEPRGPSPWDRANDRPLRARKKITRVFGRRFIRAGYVARHLNTSSIRASRALPAQRLDARIDRLIFLRALTRPIAPGGNKRDDTSPQGLRTPPAQNLHHLPRFVHLTKVH